VRNLFFNRHDRVLRKAHKRAAGGQKCVIPLVMGKST
jgi:hypothetical protein